MAERRAIAIRNSNEYQPLIAYLVWINNRQIVKSYQCHKTHRCIGDCDVALLSVSVDSQLSSRPSSIEISQPFLLLAPFRILIESRARINVRGWICVFSRCCCCFNMSESRAHKRPFDLEKKYTSELYKFTYTIKYLNLLFNVYGIDNRFIAIVRHIRLRHLIIIWCQHLVMMIIADLATTMIIIIMARRLASLINFRNIVKSRCALG